MDIPAGWKGQELGRWRTEHKARTASVAAGSSMFCFFAVLPHTSEEMLVNAARTRNASIFSCEGHSIYHSTKAEVHTWDTGITTLVNTAAFSKVWFQVKHEGKYLYFDWTVKVDADCVFFPDRLRMKLEELKPPADTPLFIKNTLPRFTLGGFLGALEVLSKGCVEMYLHNMGDCLSYMGNRSGEDGFLLDCVVALGVGYMHDVTLLHPSPIPVDCQAGEFAAYHPFKLLGDWTYCYDIAVGVAHPPGVVPPGSIEIFPEQMQHKYWKLWNPQHDLQHEREQ